mgnify:CR=1 FL=1
MTMDALSAEILADGQKIEALEKLRKSMIATGSVVCKRDLFLSSAPTLGLSQENWSVNDPTMVTCMSQEAAKGILATGADVFTKVTALYKNFGPTLSKHAGTAQKVWEVVRDMRNAASQAATKVSAQNAEKGIAAAHADLLKASAKGLANAKQIKVILLAMTAALGFVGFALTSLTSAIKQKEGMPTLSEKISAKLRSIRWPFGDLGLSAGSNGHLGELTVGGKPVTTLDQDAASQLSNHFSPSESDLASLPNGAMPDPFSEEDLNRSGGGLVQAIRAHPLATIGMALAGVVGIFLLCNKVLTYIIREGGALVKRSLSPYAATLKVRPLK